MNYPESQLILEEIKKAKNILLNCHRGPDSDSVGSALSMKRIIQDMGIKSEIICSSDLPKDLFFLKKSEDIIKVEFNTFDFSKYDLFITMDSSTFGMASGDKNMQLPNIKIIVIDHHYTNTRYGSINLIDAKISSTSELLFRVFEDWNILLSADIATYLLTGILGDTGCFQYNNVGKQSFEIAGKLIELGANKDQIVLNTYKSVDFETMKFWGKIIENLEYDKEYNFVWSAIPFATYKKYGVDSTAKEDSANLFAPVINNTDFGLIMVESDKDVLSVSFRSRINFDVSKIAQEIGGGGHIVASGAKMEGPFNEAVEKVLSACRKYAKKNS